MTLTAWVQGSGWVAEYSGPGSEEIEVAFGTKLLPTAYTVAMPAFEVWQKLVAAHSADVEVVVRG